MSAEEDSSTKHWHSTSQEWIVIKDSGDKGGYKLSVIKNQDSSSSYLPIMF